ncbi:MAG: hypothetical protein KF716_26590 [Anaerolineae bacterium]|nr:hypothetical protein [Anaerolineae bacterium]
MATHATTPQLSDKSGLLAGITRWFEPRSENRDEAFRERSIRIAVGLLSGIAVGSFALSLFAFRDPWGWISIPTLHVVALFLCALTGWLVTKQRIIQAGWTLVAIVCIGVSFLVYLARQDGNVVRQFSSIASYMVAPLLAALVLPRVNIMPVSFATVVLYCIIQFFLPITGGQAVFGLDPATAIGTGIVLILVEGLALRELRVEFDNRLSAMRESLHQTELAKQQAELSRQQAETDRQRAETADRAKSQFLANMSHELRTPLNAIIGYDEAMLGGMVGEFSSDQVRLLSHIQNNSRRLLNLINDILDLSKIESGSLEVFSAPMSPQKMLTETIESLRGLALDKHINIDVQISDSVPEVILTDSKKLQQVLVNLVSNAIKFTSEGSVTIQATTVDKAHWQFSVRDTGIGIPADALAYIFEPFRQVDNSDTRKFKGTGLGLSISKRLVEKLGGEIKVESEQGKGSVFTVIMPRVNLPEAALEKADVP